MFNSSYLCTAMSNLSASHKLHRSSNNMDFIRYILALSVLVAHYNTLTSSSIWWPIPSSAGVSGFFTMSGFLIYREFDRCPSVKTYLLRRGLRIMPPYILVVLLCAGLLFLCSTLPAKEYFLSVQWWKYLISNLLMLNFIEPSLPGVFSGDDFNISAVNGSLWTMKVEWCLYLSVIPVVWFIHRIHRTSERSLGVFIAILLLSIAYRYCFTLLFDHTGKALFEILGRQFFGELAFFYFGVIIYYFLDLFLKFRWVILALLLCGLYVFTHSGGILRITLEPLIIGGLVMWVSLIGNWGKYFSQHDNVSYDIYLFHFPIIQTAQFIGLTTIGSQYICFASVTAIITIISFFSWNLVGRRFAKLKKVLKLQ